MNTQNYPNPENYTTFRLWQVNNTWEKKINSTLAEFNLNQSQYLHLVSLAWLCYTEQDISQSRLAAYTQSNQMLTSKVVRALEKAKYITRKPHPTDTRANVLEITQSGCDIITAALEKVLRSDAAFFGPSSKSKLFIALKELQRNHNQETNL
jgi:MarR family transcriptional regulator, organic hydroperoxide resistance regulator